MKLIRFADEVLPAIAYGSEVEKWGAESGQPCYECGVVAGEYHVSGCDVERCPRCLKQLISCGCSKPC